MPMLAALNAGPNCGSTEDGNHHYILRASPRFKSSMGINASGELLYSTILENTVILSTHCVLHPYGLRMSCGFCWNTRKPRFTALQDRHTHIAVERDKMIGELYLEDCRR
jgi:hypothetical protein